MSGTWNSKPDLNDAERPAYAQQYSEQSPSQIAEYF